MNFTINIESNSENYQQKVKHVKEKNVKQMKRKTQKTYNNPF